MPHPVKAKKSSTARHEAIQGYLFVTPYLIAFTIFTGIPFVSAFVLSLLDVKFITRLDDVHFVAFKNFVRFFSNKEALAALGRTGLYTLIYVPVIMVLSFILAYLLNKGVFWAKGIRSMFFLPYVSNMVAVAVVFQLMLGPRGPFYLLQKFFGVEDPIIPLLNQKWALPVVVLIAVWKGIGLNFLTYLGALQNVDKSQVEAAEIDGANKWQQIKNVVIPAVAPTTFHRHEPEHRQHRFRQVRDQLRLRAGPGHVRHRHDHHPDPVARPEEVGRPVKEVLCHACKTGANPQDHHHRHRAHSGPGLHLSLRLHALLVL